ncbi:MAG: c-type cytochrome [Flavipsychrobacter sp.]|nr:c-type cytochrome [Flavipsychrobacter sp.]
MIRRFAQRAFIFFSVLLINSTAIAQPDGKALFTSNCASCHHPVKKSTGPALQGVDGRVPSKEWLHKWVRNSAGMIASGDEYAQKIYNEYNKTAMTAFPNLTDEEIDAIVGYVNSYKAPTTAVPAGGGATAPKEDNTWLYGVLTGILFLLGVILWRVNSGLRRAAHQKEGIPTEDEIPLYRNKVVIALTCIVVFIFCGYWIVNGAIEMGRQQNYQPEQPIFYSHKVHAGINQVNCLYCHAGAEKSRQAMIPSANVCMNCHMQINEYTSEETHPLYTAEGVKVNGTEEIKKLYDYAGWDEKTGTYKRKPNGEIDSRPIPWTKIHNLADHVYFNHSQHVAVGKVQCQQCHGDIQNMDEVYQFSPLSMGWCINCHRQTKVQFESNNYYSIFEKYHKELKSGEREGVTVEDIGGLECQRCHY